MLTIKNLYLECRQQLHNKWLYFGLILIIILGILAFNIALNSVRSFEAAGKATIAQYKDQIKQDNTLKDNSKVIADKANSFLKTLSQVVHPSAGPHYMLLVLSVLGPFFLSIISATIVGNEFSYKTVKIKAAHYGWSNSVITKQFTIFIICLSFIGIAIIIGTIGGQISWQIAKTSSVVASSPSPTIKSNILIQSLVTLLGLLFYSGISGLFAMLFKNQLAGATCGILLPYVEKHINQWFLPSSCYGNLMVRYFNYFEGSMVSSPPPSVGHMPIDVNWLMLILFNVIIFSSMFSLSRKQSI